MAYFIKKIFEGKIDNLVHEQFIRFSKGIFENKAVMNIVKSGKIKINMIHKKKGLHLAEYGKPANQYPL